jgi:hypothetical protein
MKKLAVFKGATDVAIYGALNIGFASDEQATTIRPIGTNFLKNGSVETDHEVLHDIFNQSTHNGGLGFPDINTLPPVGYKVSWFYDKEYNQVGWNWRKINNTGGFDNKEEAKKAQMEYLSKKPETEPTIPPIEEDKIEEVEPANYEPMPLGVPVLIKSGKAQVQVSSFSFGKGGTVDGQFSRFAKDGKELITIECVDDQLLQGADRVNNHMPAFNIIMPVGEIELAYRNATNRDSIKTLGMGEIHNNEGYKFYYNPAIGIFNKAVQKGGTLVSKFRIEEKDDFGFVQGNNLHKQIKLNFIKNNKIVPANMEVNYGNGVWYSFHGNFPINSECVVTIRNRENHSENVRLLIKMGDYDNTGIVKLLEANNVTLSEQLIWISRWRRNFVNGSSAEGMKEVTYKQFNNNIK